MYTTVKCLLAVTAVAATFSAVACRDDAEQPTTKDLTVGAAAAAVVAAGFAWLISETESNR